MSIVDNKVLDPKLVANVDADLQPTKKRIMGSVSYAASFMGGCVSIGTFSMGAGDYCDVYRMPCYCSSTCNCR